MSRSAVLRGAERVASLLSRGQGSQLQSSRSVGKLPVTPNPHVEEWASRRENVEKGYTFSAKNLSMFAIFGVGVPVCIYFGVLNDYNKADEFAGRPRKVLWGNQ